MAGETAQRHGREVVAVRAAARQSLAARGARVYKVAVREADGGWTEPWSWRVGVADLSARASRLRYFSAEDSPVEKIAEAAAKAWPWLGEQTPAEPGPRTGAEMIEIGRARYYGGPHRWMDWSHLEPSGPNGPLWALEAIQGTVSAELARSHDVRGEPCVRYVCEVRPGEVAGADGIELVDPPEPDDVWRTLAAEVYVDAAGLVRRIVWSERFGRRIKPGFLPRLVARADHRSAVGAGMPDRGRLWRVVEFWDYGCQVEITTPTDFIEKASIGHIVGELWRKKSRYQQRTQHAEQTIQD